MNEINLKARAFRFKYLSLTSQAGYFFLCLFFLNRFLRLWVAILWRFLFFPLGMFRSFLT
jgi:hypothetical protein